MTGDDVTHVFLNNNPLEMLFFPFFLRNGKLRVCLMQHIHVLYFTVLFVCCSAVHAASTERSHHQSAEFRKPHCNAQGQVSRSAFYC